MSKEQTPITAEDFIKQSGLDTLHFQQSSFKFGNHPLYTLMEQYAQAKVLKALEDLENWVIPEMTYHTEMVDGRRLKAKINELKQK